MALKKRRALWSLRIYLGGKQVWVSTGSPTKSVAESIERQIVVAWGAQDYRTLDPMARKACVKIFRNQGWQMPPDLAGNHPVAEELTVWRAVELCLKYPEIRNSPNRERLEQCFLHLVEHFGKDRTVKEIWIPQIKEYQIERTNQGAAAGTVNREKSTLSKMFQVLIELRHMDVNPARLVKPLSEKSDKRQAYLSHSDFQRITVNLPDWYRPIAQTAYFTGMRRGEILGLTWRRVSLRKRMVYLGPDDVKEREWKRVPIHRDLVPILERVRSGLVVGLDSVFLHNGHPVTDPTQVRWCWDRKAAKVELDPAPRFHDLRHTWKTNARRSGMHPEIERAIMGHSQRGKSVHEGYGFISDEELVRAIDGMTFDHGETQILVSGRKGKSRQEGASSVSAQRCEQNVSTRLSEKTAHNITC
ncbi:MAG: tyrosine-type recombinase/integrase [Desulfomonilaceae bacterium]